MYRLIDLRDNINEKFKAARGESVPYIIVSDSRSRRISLSLQKH